MVSTRKGIRPASRDNSGAPFAVCRRIANYNSLSLRDGRNAATEIFLAELIECVVLGVRVGGYQLSIRCTSLGRLPNRIYLTSLDPYSIPVGGRERNQSSPPTPITVGRADYAQLTVAMLMSLRVGVSLCCSHASSDNAPGPTNSTNKEHASWAYSDRTS